MTRGSEHFSGRAEDYEKGRKPFPEWVFAMLRRNMPSSEWARIVDLGCGTGISTRQLGQEFPHHEVVGIDSNQDMLEWAKKHAPLGNVWYAARDVTHLSPMFERGSVAALTAFSAFHWFSDDKDALQRLIETLAPGGCFFAVNKHTEIEVIDGWPEVLSAWVQGPIRRGKPPDFDTKAPQILERFGLRVSAAEKMNSESFSSEGALHQLRSSGLWSLNGISDTAQQEAIAVLRRCIGERLHRAGKIERQVRIVAVLGVKS